MKRHFYLTLLSSLMILTPCLESQEPVFEAREVEKQEQEEKKKAKEKEQKEEDEKAVRSRRREEEEKKKEKEFHNHFDVTFVNYDGTLLYHQVVPLGEDACYHGKIPTRPDEDGFSFLFIGWDKPLENIQCDMVFTAQYHRRVAPH